MLRSILTSIALLSLCGLSPPAQAVQRVFVSAISGNDANTVTGCAASAPCRWFAGAITVVDPNGEIVAMDSGAYGAVTISKSVSIIGAPGVYAGITVFSGNGVTIATPGVKVALRGLTINNLGSGSNGIQMTAGDKLTVQNCMVTNFVSGSGLYVNTAAQVRLLDSVLQGNSYGAFLYDGPTALVSGSRFFDNVFSGLYAYAGGAGVTTRVEVSRSEASGNSHFGFYGVANPSGEVELNLKDVVASRNGYGAGANSWNGAALTTVSASLVSGNRFHGLRSYGSGAKLVAIANTVSHNGTGLVQESSGVLQTTGDNVLTDNTIATTGAITALTKM